MCSEFWIFPSSKLVALPKLKNLVYLLNYIYIYISYRLVTRSREWPKGSFTKATIPRCRGGCNSFPCIARLILDPYIIMLSVKQRGVKCHFWVFSIDVSIYMGPMWLLITLLIIMLYPFLFQNWKYYTITTINPLS